MIVFLISRDTYGEIGSRNRWPYFIKKKALLKAFEKYNEFVDFTSNPMKSEIIFTIACLLVSKAKASNG